MIQIKLPTNLPQEIEEWKTEALRITDEILNAATLAEKHELIDSYKAHWRRPDLVNWLSDLSSEKCWYTETKFGGDYQEIEHFRPKKGTKNDDGSVHVTHQGYYWLAFELNNYRLCKSRPNRRKSTFFPILNEPNRACSEIDDIEDELPLFLDPFDVEDCLLLSFNDDGRPVPADEIEDQDAVRVNFTIDKYFLDERVLNIRRAETWSAARNLFYFYLNKSKEAKSGNGDGLTKRAKAKEALKQLKNMLTDDQEFSAVAKASLLKTRNEVAVNIVASKT